GLARIADESAAWFVAEDPASEDGRAVGLVVGELVNGEVEVRLWVCRDCRSQGFGTSALKQVRRELAAFFPGVNLVVRTPIGTPKWPGHDGRRRGRWTDDRRSAGPSSRRRGCPPPPRPGAETTAAADPCVWGSAAAVLFSRAVRCARIRRSGRRGSACAV